MANSLTYEGANESTAEPLTPFDDSTSSVNIDFDLINKTLQESKSIDPADAANDSWSSEASPAVSQNVSSTDAYLNTIFPKAMRLFHLKSISGGKSSLHRSYLLCTLRSYPRMVLRGQTPPFIHMHSFSDDLSGDLPSRSKLGPGPLDVCNELIQMYTLKNQDNVFRIWRAIRMEQDRLLKEVRHTKIQGRSKRYMLISS